MEILNADDKWFEAKKKFLDLIQHHKIEPEKIVVSFSGGKDSTLLLQLIEECGLKNKVRVVFFDTLMEFQAIYDFIKLKESQGWIIEKTKPELPAPLIYKKFGVPFKSKHDSEMLERLQKHNFDFKQDTLKSYDELILKYPKCKVGILWITQSNIKMNCPNWLRNELATNGLDFKIANKCCTYLKKKPVAKFNKENDIKLSLVGIRQAEGGIRSRINTCINIHDDNIKFFPLLFLTDDDVNYLIESKNIELCKAYTEYGLKRTGCVGCPFGRERERELKIIQEKEPNKYLACINLFGNSYNLSDVKLKK